MVTVVVLATIAEMVNSSLIFTHFFSWFYCVVFLLNLPSAPYLCFRVFFIVKHQLRFYLLLPMLLFAQTFDARNFCSIKLVMCIQIIMRNFQIAKLSNQQMNCIHTLHYSRKKCHFLNYFFGFWSFFLCDGFFFASFSLVIHNHGWSS